MSAFDKRAYYDAISSNYSDFVVSPFALGVQMPLAADVAAWIEGGGGSQVAVDFGCGEGRSLELVAGLAGHCLALDFSAGMLMEAERRLRSRGTAGLCSEALDLASAARWMTEVPERATRFCQANLHTLEPLRGHVDLAVASNSMTDDDAERSHHMFAQVASTLREGGTLLALFPSWDATVYALELAKRWDSESSELGTLNADGVYQDGGLRQKFWRPEEIEEACRASHLRVECLEKIYFSWDSMAEAGWGDFEGEPEMWDWYLRARRV